jgi:hypothetical protein
MYEAMKWTSDRCRAIAARAGDAIPSLLYGVPVPNPIRRRGQMKRLSMTAATLVATLAVGSTAVAAGDTVGSTISVKYKGAPSSDPYGTSSFKGTVGPRKCAKGRTVSVSHYGKTKTNKKGKFTLSVGSSAAPGTYKVKVAEKEIKGVTCTKVKATLTIK